MVVKIVCHQDSSRILSMKSAILTAVQFIANGMHGSGALALKHVEQEPKTAPAPKLSWSLMEERALAQILALKHVTTTIVQLIVIGIRGRKPAATRPVEVDG